MCIFSLGVNLIIVYVRDVHDWCLLYFHFRNIMRKRAIFKKKISFCPKFENRAQSGPDSPLQA